MELHFKMSLTKWGKMPLCFFVFTNVLKSRHQSKEPTPLKKKKKKLIYKQMAYI